MTIILLVLKRKSESGSVPISHKLIFVIESCYGFGMRNRNRPRLPLNALRAFEAVAHHLNFGLGARSLHVTQSAVSRHIAALEAMLGRPLFVRRARGVSLTDAGATLFPVVTRYFDAIEDTLERQVLDAIRRGYRTPRSSSSRTGPMQCFARVRVVRLVGDGWSHPSWRPAACSRWPVQVPRTDDARRNP